MISLITYYENGKKDLSISSDIMNFREEESPLLEKESTNINGKMYVFELQLKDCIPSHNIGQKHKIKAFSKILQGRQRLAFALRKLLGHHKSSRLLKEYSVNKREIEIKGGAIKMGIK